MIETIIVSQIEKCKSLTIKDKRKGRKMVKVTATSVSILMLAAGSASAFAPTTQYNSKLGRNSVILEAENSRRSFVGQIAGSVAAAAAFTTSLPTEPALAFGGGKLSKINARLARYVHTTLTIPYRNRTMIPVG